MLQEKQTISFFPVFSDVQRHSISHWIASFVYQLTETSILMAREISARRRLEALKNKTPDELRDLGIQKEDLNDALALPLNQSSGFHLANRRRKTH